MCLLLLLLLHLHTQVLAQTGLVVFLRYFFLRDGLLVLLDALRVLIKHHSVVLVAQLQVLFEVKPCDVVAAFGGLVDLCLCLHSVSTLGCLIILANIFGQTV